MGFGLMNTSGIRGVYRTVNPQRPWGGKVQHKGRAHYVGWHVTPEDAARAVERKRIELGIIEAGADDIVASLLQDLHPSLYEELLAEARTRLDAARELRCSPFELPDGWDLA